MSEMRLWMKAVPLAPVSSSTRFLSPQALSLFHTVHASTKAIFLQSAMCLTNASQSTIVALVAKRTIHGKKKTKKITTPGVPRLSPTLVLTRPEEA